MGAAFPALPVQSPFGGLPLPPPAGIPPPGPHMPDIRQNRAGNREKTVGIFTQSVAVECAQDGTPQRLRWNGREYALAERPLRWYERRRWWAEEYRAEKGRGAGLVDHEIWRLQVRLARAGNAPLQTVDVAHHLDSGRWRLIRIHDGVSLPLMATA